MESTRRRVTRASEAADSDADVASVSSERASVRTGRSTKSRSKSVPAIGFDSDGSSSGPENVIYTEVPDKGAALIKYPLHKSAVYAYSDELDPTLELFYQPHTITVLGILLAGFLYLAFYRTQDDWVLNNQMALAAIVTTVCVFGLTQFRDGPFIRPHPALWRVVLALNLCYQAFLSYLLFQTLDSARDIFRNLDPAIGAAPDEKSYAESCELSVENVWNQMDLFVVAHTLGWWGKAILIRDYWACWLLSVLFEMCEYSLEHHLANFAECWWDHWIVDVMVCNWLGTYLGMKTCEYFEMKQYNWRGIREYETYRLKIKRSLQQFTPHSWTKFEWGGTKSFRTYIAVISLITLFLLNEVMAFYLKSLLLIPPTHWINPVRLILWAMFGFPGVREAYQYFIDPNCKRFGPQAWLVVASILTEFLIVLKFGRGQFPTPFPLWVKLFWGSLATLVLSYPFYKYFRGDWDSRGRPIRQRRKFARS